MAELGKIEKPPAANFKEKRKIYVVPVLPFEDIASQFNIDTGKIERFWGEVREKIEHFISTYGKITMLFMEGIDEDQKAGIEFFERYGKESNHYRLIKSLLDRGAAIKGIDKEEHLKKSKLLFEEYSKSFLPEIQEFHENYFGKDRDFEGWRKHLVDRIQEMQEEMSKLASRIIQELPEDSRGVLFITDGRPVEFPESVDVFQIRPPAFDAIARSIRESGA